MSKERLYLYDNLKLLMIAFVVIGHMIDYGGELYTASDTCYRVVVYIYAFHMPLFIFMAGLFFKKENSAEKALYYLLTGLVMKTVIFVCQRLLYGTGAFSFTNLNGPEWFMLALAVYTVVTPLLQRLNRLPVIIVALLIAIGAGYVEAIGTFFSFSRIIVFFPYFFIGTICDAQQLCRRLHKPLLRCAGGLLIIGWTVFIALRGDEVWFMKYLFTGSTPYVYLPAEVMRYGGILRAISYLLSGLLCSAFLAVMPQRRIPLISVFGSRTVQVYFWHLPLVFAVHTVDYSLFHSSLAVEPWGYVAGALTAVGIVLLLSLKPFAFPTSCIGKACHQLCGYLSEKLLFSRRRH